MMFELVLIKYVISVKPAHDWVNKFKKNWLLGPSEQVLVNYFGNIYEVIFKNVIYY